MDWDYPSLRQVVYWWLRKKQLCDDEEPLCDGSELIDGRPTHGPDCPRDKLEGAIARNPVLQRAIDIDFANSAGFRLTLDEVDVEEFEAIKILKSERDKYQAEDMKRKTPSR